MLDDYTRAQVNRAVEDALRPSGMSVHSGRASIDAGMLQRLIVMIDRSAEASLEALDQIAVLDVENERLRAENMTLRNQRDELRADAERYQWIKAQPAGEIVLMRFAVKNSGSVKNGFATPLSVLEARTADDAIDAAIKEERK